jgi:hypothetical protein
LQRVGFPSRHRKLCLLVRIVPAQFPASVGPALRRVLIHIDYLELRFEPENVVLVHGIQSLELLLRLHPAKRIVCPELLNYGRQFKEKD